MKNEKHQIPTSAPISGRLTSDDRYASIARLKAALPMMVRASFEATYFTGLRLAGMPEE
jgi:hypothetical protein